MKYRAPIVKKICDYLRGGNARESSAILAGVGKTAFYDWMKKKPEFANAVEKAEEECQAAHILNVRRHALGEDGFAVRWTASAWWLERTNPERFGLKWQGELSGRGGKPLIPPTPAAPPADLSRFTNEQLDRLIAATAINVPPPTALVPTNGNGNGNGNGQH